ncbi:MAG TPA: hypothetical protein VIK65_02940 [Candidatus Limnocylindrales bacterium]
MPIRVEIFAAGGIAVGSVARAGHLRELLETGAPVLLEGTTFHPLDDGPARPSGDVTYAPDDIFLATTDEPDDVPVHAQWHDIALEIGPYRVQGEMPTMPGFDPGRALARPTGEFVQIRDVRIGLLAEDAPGLERPMALVNRYVVDRVEADLMLGFFFPGASLPAATEPTPAGFVPRPAPPAA